MGLIDYKNLPKISSFKDLKRHDRVYSDKYGLGAVIRFYKDQVIIGFNSGYRGRFSEQDIDLRAIPDIWFYKPKSRSKISVNGEDMSLRAFVKVRKLEKRRARLLKEIASVQYS